MESQKRAISQAKRRRNGKKWTITKIIADINSLIVQRGSRTKVKYFENVLHELLQAAIVGHEELMLLLEDNDPEFHDEWIEELSLRTNSCFAEIAEYLADRENDPPSTVNSCTLRERVERWRSEVPSPATSQATEKQEDDQYPQDPLYTEELNPSVRNFPYDCQNANQTAGFLQQSNGTRHSSDEEMANCFSRLHIEPEVNPPPLLKPKTISIRRSYSDTGLLRKSNTTKMYYSNSDSKIAETCLLYTSPSPRDKRQSRMPSSA